jgi:NAD(P)-dependent dehydrogenase (short-subunit alcohol dehydrogenase family)
VSEAKTAGSEAWLEGWLVDLASLASIRAFAQQLRERAQPFDVLFNCAGVLQQSPVRRLTTDGFEETLGVNALARSHTSCGPSSPGPGRGW